jgi:WD repeat-containing protein 68
MSNPAQPFESSRRPAAFGRQPEELHIPSAGLTNSSIHRQSISRDYAAPPDVGSNHVPSINVHTPSAQPGQYSDNAGGPALPGALQPGNVNRPPAMSVNTAPSVLPTLPQLSTHVQHQSTTPRSSMVNSHGHSRSSPSGWDQPKYKHSGAPENPKYAPSPGSAYPPRTPQGSKYSPLGLADIRPPGDLLSEVITSPGSAPNNGNGDVQVPTNSNYLAPWPIYAVDWCKWPIPGNGSVGGKLALGSYLEDSHNYVWTFCGCSSCIFRFTNRS